MYSSESSDKRRLVCNHHSEEIQGILRHSKNSIMFFSQLRLPSLGLTTTDLFYVVCFLPFSESHISKMRKYVAFYVYFFHIHICIWDSSVLLGVLVVPFLLAGSNPLFRWTTVCLFIPWLKDIWDCFQVLVITSSHCKYSCIDFAWNFF